MKVTQHSKIVVLVFKIKMCMLVKLMVNRYVQQGHSARIKCNDNIEHLIGKCVTKFANWLPDWKTELVLENRLENSNKKLRVNLKMIKRHRGIVNRQVQTAITNQIKKKIEDKVSPLDITGYFWHLIFFIFFYYFLLFLVFLNFSDKSVSF